MSASDPETEADETRTALLASQLRQSVSGFVRAVRHQTGTARTAQSDTLDLLDRLGRANVAALAKQRNVTHQTMRLAVAQLEAAGLVQLDPDPADGRSRLVTISRSGREALAGEKSARMAWIEHAIRTRLSPDEQDVLRAAIPLLDRLAAPLD